MQTFLPYASFMESAKVLDRQRLGKQRVEAWQLLNALSPMRGESKGWVNHPALRMWVGHRRSLALYGITMCYEWTRRGYRDTMAERFRPFVLGLFPVAPAWLGDEDFHLSHRSNLIRKMPQHYGPIWPDVPPDMPYVWPTQKGIAA
jgi:hypothetical protein